MHLTCGARGVGSAEWMGCRLGQIKFWEQERQRIRAEPAVAYTHFFSGEAFNMVGTLT